LGPELAGNFFGSANLRRRLQEHAAPKALRHMEALKIRRLPVINKSKRMVGILSLGDLSSSASTELLSEWAKSVSSHHH
jgi:CBS-domain-containing membrane protein